MFFDEIKIRDKMIIIFLLIIMIFLVMPTKETDPSLHYDGIVDLSDDNFDTEVLGSDLPVLVFFYGAGCEPSWEEMPEIISLAEEYKGKIKFCKIEAGNVYMLGFEDLPNPITSEKFRLEGLPWLILFNSGKEITRDPTRIYDAIGKFK